MRFGVIVAARTGSTRLPSKALFELAGKPMIVFLLDRINASTVAEKIVFATTQLSEDDKLASVVEAEGVELFRGDNEDVVKRFVDCADKYDFDYVVRVTGDCPFVDVETLDFCLEQCKDFGDFDLASTKGFFPVGIDYEIYKVGTMKKLHESDKLNSEDREHLTKYIYDNSDSFIIKELNPKKEWIYKEVHFTIDTKEDYDFVLGLEPDNTIKIEDLIKKAKICK